MQMGRINRAHARSCEEAVLASLTWICDAEQLYTDVALVLDAFTRVAAAAGSSLIDLQLHCVVDHADGSQAASTCSREEAVLASLGWICDAEKRCTDAALVLDAFTRVAAAAGKRPDRSALALRSQPCRWVASTVLMLGLARKLSLRVSRGSVTLL